MANKKITEDPKVFDVARPGKGRIVTTSRPVVAPLVAESVSEAAGAEAAEKPMQAPSAARKIIQPINVMSEDTSAPVEVKTEEDLEKAISAIVDKPEPKPEEAIITEPVEPKVEETTEQQEPTIAEEPKSDPEPVPTPSPDPASSPTETEPPKPEETETSETASVDAVVAEVGDKKESAKKAEEQAKRDQEVQALIDSKKYVVPIGHESVAEKKNTVAIILFILVILVLGAYAAIDAELVDVGLKLPYDLIKQ